MAVFPVLILIVMFVVVRLILGEKRNSSANVFTIHGATAVIENKIGPEDNQDAIPGFQRFSRSIPVEDSIDIAVFGLVNEFATFVVYVSGPATSSLNDPDVQHSAVNRGSTHGA